MAKVLDHVLPPAMMWVENAKTGDVVRTHTDILGPPLKGGPNEENLPSKADGTVGVFRGLEVREDMYDDQGSLMSGSSTINCAFPFLKYLVEERGWTLNDAAILYTDMCEGCANVCLQELGESMDGHDPMETNTFCPYCKYVRPERYEQEMSKDPEAEARQKQWESRRGTPLWAMLSAAKALPRTGYDKKDGDKTATLTISGKPENVDRVLLLLRRIAYNGGHSSVYGIVWDGDGSDSIHVEGDLPEVPNTLGWGDVGDVEVNAEHGAYFTYKIYSSEYVDADGFYTQTYSRKQGDLCFIREYVCV